MANFYLRLMSVLAAASHDQLRAQIQYLRAENQTLRAKLGRVVRTTPDERARLVQLAAAVGDAIKELVSIVQPCTLLKWVRQAKCGVNAPATPRRKGGSRRTPDEVRAIIVRLRSPWDAGLGRDNAGQGATAIRRARNRSATSSQVKTPLGGTSPACCRWVPSTESFTMANAKRSQRSQPSAPTTSSSSSLRIETIPVSKINPAPYNPRVALTPGDPEYQKLQRSLDEFGLVEPLVWNRRTGTLVGGHQRFAVLVAQGKTEIPVSVVDLPVEREKALNLALNKITGRWDEDKLAQLLHDLSTVPDFDLAITGFELPEAKSLIAEHLLAMGGDGDDGFDLDAALAAAGPTVTKPGDLILLGRDPRTQHRLLCGDSTNPDHRVPVGDRRRAAHVVLLARRRKAVGTVPAE